MRILGNYWLMRSAGVLALSALAFGGLSACGDEDTTGDRSDVPLFDSSNAPDTQAADTLLPPTDTMVIDTNTNTDTGSTPPDLVPDLEAPTIVSTSPADGASNVALPLVVTITFSEPLYGPTVASQSVKLVDFAGDEVPGTPVLSQDGTVVTWTPTTNDQQKASPYTIKVVNFIKDLAGNTLEATQEYTFTTANFPDQDGYRAIAEAYAPNIYSSVDGSAPQAQIPTKLDADGDWNLDNNRDWLSQIATSVVPAVYYAVAETPTHYFIHYYLYFPWVNHPQSTHAHGNGATAYMVTVEKARDGGQAQRAVALHSFWKEGTSEENYAFVTTESGIVGAGGASDWSVMEQWSEADLFPSGRFDALITAKTHRACLWDWDQGGALSQCDFDAGVENGDTLLFTYKGGAPTPVQRGDSGWPKDMGDVDGVDSFGYALVPALSSLWPRRFNQGTGEMYEVTSFTYSPDATRPPAGGIVLTSKMRDPLGSNLSAYGRALWALGWNPSNGSGANGGFAKIKQGQLALDPAWYVWERHHSSVNANGLVEFNADTGAGFAVDYCFNGLLSIDVRASEATCQ